VISLTGNVPSRAQPGRAQPGSGDRSLWWYAGLFALVSVVVGAWLVLDLGGRRTTDVVDDWGQLVAPLAAAVFCGLAWRRAPKARLSWGLIGASCACWAAGEVVWCYYDLLRRVAVPFPSLADAGYLSALVLFVAGLVSFPGATRRVSSPLRRLLDSALIAGPFLFVSWALIVSPGFRGIQGGSLRQILLVSYPSGDVVVVSLALIVVTGAAKSARAALGLVALGCVACAVADGSFIYLTAEKNFGVGSSFDMGWVAGYFLIGLGALRASRDARCPEVGYTSDRVTLARLLAPYGAVGLAAVVALVRYADGRPFGPFLTFEGFVLIVALVARQFLTLEDNMTLNRRLVAKVERGNEELRAREQRFAALGLHSSDPITVVGPDGVVVFQSPSVERVLGWGPEATAGRNIRDMMHPADHKQWWTLVDRALASPNAEVTAEWRVRHGDGSWRSLQSVVTNLIDEPTVAGLVLNSRDITAQKALEEQLRFQAFHDPLTGLANRALFEENLGRAVQRCRRTGGSLEVISIDLHNFKAINDLHGDARGDQLLREVGDRLQGTFRDAEVVARLGGDEFAVLIEVPGGAPGVGAGADAAAERLLDSFSRPFGDGTNQVVLQVIVGVAVSGPDGEPDKELLRNADLAMNVAREDGAGSLVRFTPAVHQRILDRMRIEIDLQRALARDELVLYYQPVVELASGEIKGVEALIRWAHPEKGLVPPGMFIAVAESSGLIVTIGEWVLRQACQDLGKWAGPGAPKLRMSVNVSARQLSHPGFEDMVVRVLGDSGADPDLITLEITESMLIHDTAGKADVLERLRAMGTRIALDDFGTGYSSLSSIREMPIDILKIDKSFIDNIASSPEAVSLTQTIIRLANDLGLTTIAEGAEKLEQVEILRELGCQLVQGYYFSKPVPATELQTGLRRGTWGPVRVTA
jgi:diguanylate cyclase (GGDEF)-like protein/PAS domain S-box-containing protein